MIGRLFGLPKWAQGHHMGPKMGETPDCGQRKKNVMMRTRSGEEDQR